jgi:hypothetical protein
MTIEEFAVLSAVNIASTRHQIGQEFQATARQIAEVLNTDDRLRVDFPDVELTPLQTGQHLRYLADERWAFGALVQRVGTKKWQLTSSGARVLGA